MKSLPCHLARLGLALLIFLLPQAVATPALASCISPYSCLCSQSGSTAVVQVKVMDVHDERTATVEIEALDDPNGTAIGLAVGATTTAARANSLWSETFEGTHFLGHVESTGQVIAYAQIDADERINCIFMGNFRPKVADARMAMASADCPEAMRALGFQEQPCNDTTVVDAGCTAAPVASSRLAYGLALLAYITVWLRRRQLVLASTHRDDRSR